MSGSPHPKGRRLVWAQELESLCLRLWLRLIRRRVTMKVGRLRAVFAARTEGEWRRVTELCGERALLQRLIGMLRPGEVVYDVGANVGTHTILFALAVGSSGRVIGFDPEPGMAERLRQNVRMNRLGNVVVIQKALGNRADVCTLHVHRKSGSGQHSLLEEPGREAVQVEMMEGDRLIKEQRLPPPNVVKIDVEGAEVGVIQGLQSALRQADCRLVCCEIHPRHLQRMGQTPEEVESALRELGFVEVGRMRRQHEYHWLGEKAPLLRQAGEHGQDAAGGARSPQG